MITGRQAILANGTLVIDAGDAKASGSTGITDSSFTPVITIAADGSEKVYVEYISYSGGVWKFRVERSVGVDQPALNIFWKVIALKPYKEA